MSESGKNASGQEAFGSKANETLVGESPAVSTADVTSAAGGTGATVASEADKGGTSTAPATEEEGGDLCMADSRPTSDPQATEAGGAEDDAHWCLYVGTPWEAEVVADHRDVDEFKEVSRTIGRVMSVRVLAWVLEFLTLGHCILQGLITVFSFSWYSLLSIERRLGQVCCRKQPMPMRRSLRPARLSFKPRSKPRRRSNA
jgi:hypothetical protein